MVTRDDIKKDISAKRKDIQSDSPSVEIARMNIEAISKLADDKNDVFSELRKDNIQDETLDYTLGINFAMHPLPGLESRLAKRGITRKVKIESDLGLIDVDIPIRLKVDTYISFLKEFLIRRHCLGRSRVNEYIDALDKANGKENILRDQPQRQSIFQRLG